MSLKLAKGVLSLSQLPKRIKLIGIFSLTLIALLTLLSETSHSRAHIQTASKPSKSTASNPETKPASVDNIVKQAVETTSNKTAKLVTCPRCRLNALPLVKKFVHEHAKLFEPQLKVDFIFGEDPVLYLYEDSKQVAKYDLADFDWKQIIQKLVNFGIEPKQETEEIRIALDEM